ncbi:unnamed protein product [Vicia faba]|uniref:P-loop containing nucleoside triphosphate hydrolase, leucine-rich repeat domain, L n=1 Tax=Vicia faba TaxID=3906 RepID=A0AAV0ZGI6_VICFA|nr:unnamed protein product [Vicia faba]
MEAIVGGALLSASMEMLVKKVVSGEFLDLFRRTKLDVDLLEKLEITLLSLQSVLHDAEDKQIANPAVKKWLEMLQDAVFEADYLFDELNTQALRCQAEGGQVLNKFLSYFKRFNKKINSKLQKLFGRLEHLKDQNLGLKEGDSNCVWNATPTSPFLGDESAIYGRDDDRKKLEEFLLLEYGCDSGSKIGVISIVGMGGLGKTTLAKLLYNDPRVKEMFEVEGWAHIPKDFNVATVTKTILESVTLDTSTDTNLLKLQVQLQQSLSNKKFLLVLDDMWYGNYVGWNSLIDIFNVGQNGSKIIITTRDERVVLPTLKYLCVHHLRSLETEDSWSLLARHAFVETNYQQHPNLEIIGREIAKKCGGLPLAAVALGGILRTNLSQDHWNDVLNNSIWENTNDEVQPALLLSYRFLPAFLKGCFAYCSIFPKNSILVKKRVVQLWIAEGLVPRPESEKNWEKVAEKYFDELVSRSLIRQRFLDHEENNFEMHDLINDLAMTVSSPYCTKLDNDKPSERVDKRVRHLSYNKSVYEPEDKFDELHGLKGLRTFLATPLGYSKNPISLKLFSDLLSTMTQLHVLSLSYCTNIVELPKSIGNLICLRYLNLSYTRIKRLPSETCKLYNLQTLLLTKCVELTKLPKDMGKLVKLRHLDIRGTELKKMPAQISKLENLQTLSDFIVSSVKEVGLKIEDLGKYPHLSGSLCISQLENVTDPSHASQANLEMKKEIDKLKLGWSYITPLNSEIQNVVLERLRPSTNLKSLAIFGYGGDRLPNWMICLNSLQKMTLKNIPSLTSFPSDCLPKTLQYLNIEGCDSFTSFTLCSLPVLKILSIVCCKLLKSILIAEDASKQNLLFLRTIDITDCNDLESVSLIGLPIPNLTDLSVNGCEKLRSLPESIKTLTSLQIMKIVDLPNLQSFSIHDLPISLRYLSIGEVGGIWWNTTWEHLTSLSMLDTWGDDIVKGLIERQVPFLPTNLVSLHIYCLEDVECLDGKWLQHLTSLHKLEICMSPKLKSLPEKGDLPSSLKQLHIHYCPLLEPNLKMKQGKEWLKISHIPQIYVNQIID